MAGEFYVNAINVMRGAETISTYEPIAESEKFRVEYWELEEAKLRRLPPPRSHEGRVALVTGAAERHRPRHRPAPGGRGACRPGGSRSRPCGGRRGPDREFDVAVGVSLDVTTERDVEAATEDDVAGLRRARPRGELRRPVALQDTCSRPRSRTGTSSTTSWPKAASSCHGPRRASWSIRESEATYIVYICSKNAVFAGPNNIASSYQKDFPAASATPRIAA